MADDARRPIVLAWVLWGAVIVLLTGSAVMFVLGIDAPSPTGAFAFRGYPLPLSLSLASVGLLIAVRRPRNPIGWMLLACGLLAALTQFGFEYALYTLLGDGRLPGGTWAAWIQEWIWIPVLVMMGFILLLLPEGRLVPGGRVRGIWLIAAGTFAILGTMVKPGPLESFREVENPPASGLCPGLRRLWVRWCSSRSRWGCS